MIILFERMEISQILVALCEKSQSYIFYKYTYKMIEKRSNDI